MKAKFCGQQSGVEPFARARMHCCHVADVIVKNSFVRQQRLAADARPEMPQQKIYQQ